MTPYQHAREFYGSSLDDEVGKFISLPDHYLLATPTVLVMANIREGDTWFVEFYAGDVLEWMDHIPKWLPYVAFFRKGKHRIYTTASLVKRLSSRKGLKKQL